MSSLTNNRTYAFMILNCRYHTTKRT